MSILDPLSRRASVLVVDDEKNVRDLICRILGRAGHTCDGVGSGEEARDRLATTRYDIVLCDVLMPGDDGLRLLDHLAGIYPTLPVVMVSGIGDISVATNALQLGAYGWITKPFDANEVLIAVANALIRARLERQARDHEERLEEAVARRTAELRDTVARLEQSEDELQRVSEDTIAALTRAIERRDIETGDHVERVSRYAEMLARHYGLAADRCEMIRRAAPMHDVGKIGIPDGILLKPSRVSSAEFMVIKQHSEFGHSILSRSNQPLLVLAAGIARSHHERWDGMGYPDRIVGEDIMLEGRMTAIADTFDALVSRRVYKLPVPVDQAYEIIARERATHLDPELVDLFLDNREEAAAIMGEYPDL
jgi:cyclic di-GMP phosphodiesterase